MRILLVIVGVSAMIAALYEGLRIHPADIESGTWAVLFIWGLILVLAGLLARGGKENSK